MEPQTETKVVREFLTENSADSVLLSFEFDKDKKVVNIDFEINRYGDQIAFSAYTYFSKEGAIKNTEEFIESVRKVRLYADMALTNAEDMLERLRNEPEEVQLDLEFEVEEI